MTADRDVAVVTGAASGFGRALTEECAGVASTWSCSTATVSVRNTRR